MSSRSLNGKNLTLNDLSVTGSLTMAELVGTDLTVSNDTSLNDLTVSGASSVEGLTVAQTATCSNLVVNTNTTMNDATVTDLTVTGKLTAGSNALPMEILYVNITGNASAVNETITLGNNTTGTLDYSVFPSFYYGYSGSGGTYDIGASCNAVSQIMITNRTTTNFGFYMNKGTGDNINIYVVFLVIYSVGTSGYPSNY